jgi:hypothetical protein
MPIHYDASADAVFRPHTTRFPPQFTDEKRRAVWALEACRLAYCPAEDGDAGRQQLEAGLALLGFSLVHHTQGNGENANAFIARRGETALVAFRGTELGSLANWSNNVKAVMTHGPKGSRVHTGFQESLAAIAAELEAVLPASNDLVVVGHSLGGAMATLFASGRPGCRLVTIGSPRVGDAAFAATLAGVAIERWVCCDDAVPALPPVILGYTHVTPAIFIDRGGTVHHPAPGDDPDAVPETSLAGKAAAALRNVQAGSLLLPSVTDHAPINSMAAAAGVME